MAHNPRPKSLIVITCDELPTLPLEPTHDPVWLSPTCRCKRWTLRGVPGRVVDVIVDERITCGEAPDGYDLVCSVVRKPGRFDGATRDRLAFRAMAMRETGRLAHGAVTMEETDAAISISIRRPGMRGWKGEYARLRSDLSDYDLPRIVVWHWRRYYAMLPAEDVYALADSMTWLPDGAPTLAEANRAASRALYRLARDMGWRKLTARERAALGLRSMWVREEDYAAAHARRQSLLSPTGAGEATILAAGCQDFEIVRRSWADYEEEVAP